MTSPFASTAANYRERGLAILPCGPGTKFPGRYAAANGWSTQYDWQKYCDRLPTDFELDIWEKWPNAGVCLALGRSSAPAGLQLVAVDIDTEEPAEVAAIRAVLPGSPVRKRGAKGETEFYLAPVSVPNRPYNDAAKRRMLDLLGHGRQTVLPPSIHPDCPHCGSKGAVSGADMACNDCGAIGNPYAWTTLDTLDNFDVADLPVLPADIADILGRALAPFGHVDAPKLGGNSADPDAEASTHRELNDTALANLGAWVPALNLYKCRQVGGKYKAVSHWRPSSSGRPLSARAANLAISAEGIKDCGEGKGYTPLDLVMAACDADLDTAFRWLQERVAPAPAVILSARVPAEEPFVRTSPAGNLAGLRLAASDGVAVQPMGVAVPAPPLASIIPPALCTPPGLIGDMVEWMNAASPVPSPQLNLATAIAFLGAIYGRRYEAPTGARTNFYAIGVAPSGFGKSFPLKCVSSIEQNAGLGRFFGPSGLKSDSALRKLLEVKNPVFLPIDEVGELFRRVLHRKAASHEAGLRELLLNLFSEADNVYRGSEGASEKAVPIVAPHLCILGMSTPSAWWSAFSTANAENGLLPRILIFDAGKDLPDEVTPAVSRREVPASIIEGLHASLDIGGNLAALPGSSQSPLGVPWGEGAGAYHLDLKREMKAKCRRASGLEELAYSRFAEHAIKLGLLLAISRHPVSPVIEVADLQWGRDVVEFTTRTLLDGATDRVADSEYQADYKRILRLVKEGGPHGIAEFALNRMLSGSIDRRRMNDIIDQLGTAREIVKAIGTGPKGGRPGTRFTATQHISEVA
ncbi:MAG: hypothetical protein E7773_00775 [Sphingomonas sp.]|uniref:bifunctional DNA primase/polymerase n=1 Tax=Sphingomonas sp. TaxID=28214 RepID=UPI00121FE922|nr:bifunctional DNA primase/polymerase [Sphingomonas sp.]THD38320.1 MAG: hypothetical protein E7773_00775 [Sphingomonas sp.]